MPHAGVAGRWRSMVAARWGPKQFSQYWLQRVSPNLVRFERGMQAIAIHHAGEKPSVLVCDFAVDIQITILLPICEPRQALVNRVDGRKHRQTVVPWKDPHEDNRRFGRLL